MAKVFADDFALSYVGTTKFLSFTDQKVYDTSGNNNGKLDPGETVSLTAFFKNICNVPFTGLNTTLSSASPYVTILHNHGYFGPIPVGTTKENYGDPYIVNVSGATPMGQLVDFRIIASETDFCDTFDFQLKVGRHHYYVWNPDPTPQSGNQIDSLLKALGYSGHCGPNLIYDRGTLDDYEAVFVCLGVYPNNRRILNSDPEAAQLIAYLNSGGRLYLEGGDVWFWDPQNGCYNFGPAFGITPTADGSSNMGPVAGQSGTFTNNMNFGYAGENNWMDNISPDGNGSWLIFKDTDNNYDCGVARNSGAYRTVGTSFELGWLIDGADIYSKRRVLVDSILKFFGVTAIGIAEQDAGTSVTPILTAPNPFRNSTTIKMDPGLVQKNGKLQVFDAAGRLVRSLTLAASTVWNGTDDHGRRVAPGIYFITLDSGATQQTNKVILLH